MKRSFACGLFALLTVFAAHADALVLSVGAPPESPGVKLILDRERRAFAALGYELSFVNLPGDRSLVEANAGRTDGDAGRIDSAGVGPRFPELVRVAEPVGSLAIRAYFVRPQPITGLKDLVLPGRKVVVYSGVLWAMTVVKSMVAPEDFLAVSDYPQAMRMLQSGRADVIVGYDAAVEAVLAVPEFASVRTGPVLISEPVHLYLNKSRAALIPLLEERLRLQKP